MVFKNITTRIKKGLYRLDGINGSGKSTFLRLIAGMDRFDDGTKINIFQNMLYLTTDFLGIHPLTIKENIELLWKAFNIQSNDEQKKCVLDLFGENINDLYMNASTGTKAKLGLSLIFVKHWDYIIIDETLALVDKISVEKISKELVNVSKVSTIIYVFHNLNNECLEKNSKLLCIKEKKVIEKRA